LPHAWEVFAAAILLGIIGGILQWKSFNEAKAEFLKANTMLNVRATLKSTTWGGRYLYVLWGGNLLLVLLSIVVGRRVVGGNPFSTVLMGLFTMMCVRELITLPPTFQLRQLLRQQGMPSSHEEM
jgi:putative Mn2+ efflux pump MntP